MDKVFLTHSKADKDFYKKIIEETSTAITQSFCDEGAFSGITPQALKETIKVENMLPQRGLGWEKVFDEIKTKVLPHFLHTPSVKYMAHLHSAALVETIASELIISTFNQSMDSWDQSPVATEIELEVIKKLCSMYAYPQNSDGIFTSGGSQSNQTAIILARDWFCNEVLKYDVKKYGLPQNFQKLRMYTSEISHFSMEKSAHILGLGYQCVVKVPVDKNQKIDIKEFKRLIEEDKAKGNIPFLAVATIGTTDFGSIDPFIEMSQICKENKMWLHADAAYGSALIMSEKYCPRINGINVCDSITVDFHKMFMMPISCSAVLIKDKKNFDSLTIHADYLNRTEDEEDGYTNLVDKSLQTTRRFDGLKVWVSFQIRGQDGWNELINTCVENAEYLYSILQNDPSFETVCPPEISSVVFRTIGSKNDDEVNKKIRRTLIHKYGTVIGQTVCNNSTFLKFTLLNPLISHKNLEELVKLIKNLCCCHKESNFI